MKVDWEGRHRNINCDEGIAAALEKVDTKRFGLFLDYIRRAERSYYQAVRQIERTQAERRKRELHDVKMEEFLTRKLGRQQAMGSFGQPVGQAGRPVRANLSAPPSPFGNIPDA
jgi:hypothetical protein